MKAHRNAKSVRKPARRRSTALSLSQRVERLEKELFFKTPAAENARFVNIGADGKPTSGEHIAIYDRTTGLTWAAEPLAAGKDMSHADAMKACGELALLGHKDWRAPTVRELLTIIDYERRDPAVDPGHFKGPFGWTWTSTPFASNPSGVAWGVYLCAGNSGWSFHDHYLRARAVRAGQPLGLLD